MSQFQVHCGAVLAGGVSGRMGREKALIPIDGVPLIRRSVLALSEVFAEVAVITSSEVVAGKAGAPGIPDTVVGRGPAGGIHAALKHFARPVFVVACDMPSLESRLLRLLVEAYGGEDALVPCGPDGPEPLHAIYGPQALGTLEHLLQETKPPSLRRILTLLNTRYVEAERVREISPDWACFANWNSPEDVRNTPSSEE